MRSRVLSRIIVSTDSREIADHAARCGAEVPFLRTADLAGDATPMIEVLRHVLAWLDAESSNRGIAQADGIVLLQPTSPLRTAEHVIAAVRIYRERRPESLVSVVEVPHNFNPLSVQHMGADGTLRPYLDGQTGPLRRQEKPRVYGRNGPAILIVSRECLQAGRFYGPSTLGFEMPAEVSLDIDTSADLRLAEYLLRQSC